MYNGSMTSLLSRLSSLLAPSSQNPSHILVDESALLSFFQSGSSKDRQRQLAARWRDMELQSHAMTPGTALTRQEFLADFNDSAPNGEAHIDSRSAISAMSGKDCKLYLKRVFGEPTRVEADVGTCQIWSFDFEGSTFIANWRSSKGMGWEWIHQDAPPSALDNEQGRSYGRAVLLSHDKEAPAAWARFCRIFTHAYGLGPERSASLLESLALDEATAPARSRSKPPRC